MARPRMGEGPSAVDRLEAAFWDMLGEMPYDQMTVGALARRAHVNHNTVYYHFGNLEELAEGVFERNLMPGLAARLMALMASGDGHLPPQEPDETLALHFERACLFARSDSSLLQRIFRNGMRRTWLEALGIDERALTPAQACDLTFVFGGLTALLNEEPGDVGAATLAALRARPLGIGITQTLAHMTQADNEHTR